MSNLLASVASVGAIALPLIAAGSTAAQSTEGLRSHVERELDRASSTAVAGMKAEFERRDRSRLLRQKFTVDAFLTPILLLRELGQMDAPDVARLLRFGYEEDPPGADPVAPDLLNALSANLAGFRLDPGERIAFQVRSRHDQHSGFDVPALIAFAGAVSREGGWFTGEWFEPCLATEGVDFPVHPEGFMVEWSTEGMLQRDSREGPVKYRESFEAGAPWFQNPVDVYALSDAVQLFPWLLGPGSPTTAAAGLAAPQDFRPDRITLRRPDGSTLRTTRFTFDGNRLERITIHQEPLSVQHTAMALYEVHRSVEGRPANREAFRPVVQTPYLRGGRTITIDFRPGTAGWPGVVPDRLVIESSGEPLFEAQFTRIERTAEHADEKLFPIDPAVAEARARRESRDPRLYTEAELLAAADPLVRRERLRHNLTWSPLSGDARAVARELDLYRRIAREDGVDDDLFLMSIESWFKNTQPWLHLPMTEAIDRVLAPVLDTLSDRHLLTAFVRQLDQHRLGMALISSEALLRRQPEGARSAWIRSILGYLFGWGNTGPRARPSVIVGFPYDSRWDQINWNMCAARREQYLHLVPPLVPPHDPVDEQELGEFTEVP